MIGLIGFIPGMQGGLTLKTKHIVTVNYHSNRSEEEKLWSSGKRKNKHLNSVPFMIKALYCCCSVAQTLCDPMDCSTPGFPILHHFPEPAQTHIH